MRRLVKTLAAAALLTGGGAVAQAPMTQAQTLDCAIFAAAVAGGSIDKEVQSGAGFFMSWLVGRYEGATGVDINAAMKRRSSEMTQDDLNTLQPFCIERMQIFGQRMTVLGKELLAQSAPQTK